MAQGTERPRYVLHVLPSDLPRGSQALARALCDRLDGRPDRHEALSLFRAPTGALRPEHCLDVVDGPGRARGLSPLATVRLAAFLRRQRPDVVVSHGSEVLKYTFLAQPRSIPLVYYRIGTSNEHLADRSFHRRMHTRLVGRAAKVLCVSEGTAAEAVELFGIARSQIDVIPNLRDPERFRPREPGAGADGPLRLLFVGHVSREKGADRFARLVTSLRDEGLDVVGVVAGGGPLLDELGSDAQARGLDVRGLVADVPSLLPTCDVFVFPGIDREGMPGVLIEAGMCALPAVATDLPGVREVVADGETGFVVDPADDDALAARVRQLCRDPELRARLGAAARARCIDRFSTDAVARQWQAQIDRLLGRS